MSLSFSVGEDHLGLERQAYFFIALQRQGTFEVRTIGNATIHSLRALPLFLGSNSRKLQNKPIQLNTRPLFSFSPAAPPSSSLPPAHPTLWCLLGLYRSSFFFPPAIRHRCCFVDAGRATSRGTIRSRASARSAVRE